MRHDYGTSQPTSRVTCGICMLPMLAMHEIDPRQSYGDNSVQFCDCPAHATSESKGAEVRALRTKDISPRIVWESVRKEIESGNVDSIYVITLKNLRTSCYASGDLNQIGLAFVAFQDLVSKFINDQIDEE